MNYYIDIETTGFNPKEDKIITIQYAKLERNTGKQIGDLTILKEWELGGEKQLLEKFIADTSIVSSYSFDFVSVGYNLVFEHKFLNYKSKLYGTAEIDVLCRPHLDLYAVGILINRGEFKGSGLDKITGKSQSGGIIPEWYNSKEYSKIENYIIQEADEFIKFETKLYEIMPGLRSKIR